MVVKLFLLVALGFTIVQPSDGDFLGHVINYGGHVMGHIGKKLNHTINYLTPSFPSNPPKFPRGDANAGRIKRLENTVATLVKKNAALEASLNQVVHKTPAMSAGLTKLQQVVTTLNQLTRQQRVIKAKIGVLEKLLLTDNRLKYPHDIITS